MPLDDAVVDETVDEAPSLRDTIEDAVEEHDPEHVVIPASSEPKETPPLEPAPISTGPPKAAEPSALPAPTEPVVPPAAAVTTDLKAPAQWKPAVREKWNALPREVQEEVLRREGDSMRLIGSVGPKIRMADTVQAHIEPFREALSANGMPPEAFVNDIFTSVKSLASGSPQERAEVVANIVQSYGVDLKTLDAVLTQRLSYPPEVLQARQLAARAHVVIQQQSAGVEHQNAMEAERAIVAFAADPKHEFIDDVRDMMADLIELGRAKTLDDAYAAAVWSNPDTRKILLTREAQSRAAVKTNRANAARRASSAVHGAPSVPGAAAKGAGERSLRAELEAAFDESSPL